MRDASELPLSFKWRLDEGLSACYEIEQGNINLQGPLSIFFNVTILSLLRLKIMS